tara:strand:- start:6577 stop:6897 length:321 start_codon:yes stop_codon:yes gene_type:complete
MNNMFAQMNTPINMRDAKFRLFHEKYPEVYDLWDNFTKEAIIKGAKSMGSQMIFERIRWETKLNMKTNEAFKLNDHLVPYYARLWMEKNPDYPKFFNTRKVEGQND